MQPPKDLKTIATELSKRRENAASKRTQAQTVRDRAMGYIQQGDEGKATYHTREAEKLDNAAIELENEIPQLEAAQAMIEKMVNDLQTQRSTVAQQNPDRVADIDRQIIQLRGA